MNSSRLTFRLDTGYSLAAEIVPRPIKNAAAQSFH